MNFRLVPMTDFVGMNIPLTSLTPEDSRKRSRKKNDHQNSIKLGNFFHLEEVRSLLPNLLNEDENLPTIVYSFEGTRRNKIFNYK